MGSRNGVPFVEWATDSVLGSAPRGPFEPVLCVAFDEDEDDADAFDDECSCLDSDCQHSERP